MNPDAPETPDAPAEETPAEASTEAPAAEAEVPVAEAPVAEDGTEAIVEVLDPAAAPPSPESMSIDGLDPAIALITLVLVWAAKKYAVPPDYRKLLPALAIALAVFGRAAMTAMGDDPITAQVLLHGAGSGFAAVWAYEFAHGFQKATAADPAEPPTDEKHVIPEGEGA